MAFMSGADRTKLPQQFRKIVTRVALRCLMGAKYHLRRSVVPFRRLGDVRQSDRFDHRNPLDFTFNRDRDQLT